MSIVNSWNEWDPLEEAIVGVPDYASIYGVDLFNKMEEVRKFTGVCPQYDVLFDLLTPEEHLDFFYEMKGASED